MFKRLPYIVTAAILFGSSQAMAAQSNPDSGFVQLPQCKSYSDPKTPVRDQLGGSFCAGQLRALAYVSHALPSDLRSCVPDGAPNGQLVIVVIHYLEAHPERLNDDFMALALQAYREAWPSSQCRD